MRISRLTLHTVDIVKIKGFYSELGFPVSFSTDDEIGFHVGTTELIFKKSDQDVFYHFAFTIPENQITESISWLKSFGIPVLIYEGNEVIEFGLPFDAAACYFHDPAGNIVELIARHRLSNINHSDFTWDKIECVSEIGLPTPNVKALSRTLCNELDVTIFDGQNSDRFTAIGDDEGLLIVVREGRGWLPTGREAKRICPLEVVVSNNKALSIQGTENSYAIYR